MGSTHGKVNLRHPYILRLGRKYGTGRPLRCHVRVKVRRDGDHFYLSNSKRIVLLSKHDPINREKCSQ